MKVMFRAFGYDRQDSIVSYSIPRETYEDAEGDIPDLMSEPRVYSSGVEKRFVRDEVELVAPDKVGIPLDEIPGPNPADAPTRHYVDRRPGETITIPFDPNVETNITHVDGVPVEKLKKAAKD